MASSRESRSRRADLVRLAVPLAVVVALGLAWRFGPLEGALEQLESALESIRELRYAPLLVITGYVLGALVVAPLSVMMVATVVAFGPLEGAAMALAGAVAGGVTVFLVGRWLGRDAADRLLGGRARRVVDRVAGRGILAVALLRNIPMPYSLVNLAVGASPVTLRAFTAGTVVGLLPGLAAMVLLGDRIRAFVSSPDATNFAILAGVVAVLTGTSLVLGRWLLAGRRGDGP